MHEEEHVNGWHSVDVMLMEIINIIFWISPMVYFYKKSIRTVHEYLADAVVLQTTPTKKYGHLLLKQSQSGLQVALANHFIHSQLKQRIVMMTRSKSNRQAMVKYLFALPVVLLLFVLFSKKEIQAQTKTSSDETVPVVGFQNSKSTEESTVDAFDAFDFIDDTNITVNFDREKIKKELRAVASKYNRNSSKAHNEKVRIEFNKLMRAYYKKHYDHRTEVFAIVDELIKEYNIGWAQESSHTNGVSVIDWPSQEYLEQTKKDARASNRVLDFDMGASEKDDKASKKLRTLLANGKNTHVSLKSLIPENIKNPLVIIDGKKNTSKDEMYFTVGKITTIKIEGGKENILANGGNADNDAVVFINLNKNFKPTKEESKDKYRVVTKHLPNGDKEHVIIDESKLTQQKSTDPVFKVVEEMPRFYAEKCESELDDVKEKKKCAEMAMLNFIYSNIRYPKAARDAGIEGKVIVQFTVEKDGSLSEIEVLREPGGGTGAEAKRVLESSPNWVPGKQRGELVRVNYVLPIRYKLEGDAPKKEKPKPLVVIDGKVDKTTKVESIFPDDIAMVNFLKGEAAFKKYGEAAKNGVVEITTKKGINTKYYINGERTTKEKFLSIPKEDIIEIKEDGMEVHKNGTVTKMLTTMDAITKSNSNFKLEEVPVDDGSSDTKVVWKEQTAQEAGFTYINISPNPTDGRINIEYGTKDEKLLVTGTDINGKQIFNFNLPGGRSSIKDVDVSKAAKGIILVTFRQGKNVYTEKVILQ